MASNMVHENWGSINGQDGFDHELQVPEIDRNVLMSLLDDLQMEEEGNYDIQCDDERLTSVIQSLQAEIDPIMIEGHDSSSEIEWDETWSGCQYSDDFQVDDQDCSASSSDLDEFNWMEMDEVSTMYLENCGEGIELGDYSHIPSYGVMPLEEHGYASFL